MAFSTACRAWSLTSGLPLMTRDAVARDTPAAAATCLIVALPATATESSARRSRPRRGRAGRLIAGR